VIGGSPLFGPHEVWGCFNLSSGLCSLIMTLLNWTVTVVTDTYNAKTDLSEYAGL